MSIKQKSRTGTPVHGKAYPPYQNPDSRPILKAVDAYLSRKTLTSKSRAAYQRRLSFFTAFLNRRGVTIPQAVKQDDILAFAASIGDREPATRAAYLRTVKDFFSYLVQEQVIFTSPASRLTPPRTRPKAPFPLPERDVQRLLSAPDLHTLLGLRDRAILETLYATGMRAGECAHLKVREVDLSTSLCFIARGKGGKGRWTPLTDSAVLFLRLYLERSRPRLANGRPSPFLFLTRTGKRLQVQDIRYVCRVCGEKAGIQRRVHPHLLRHSAACHLLENGASIRHVQALLGHRKLSTTQVYTKAPIGRLKKVLKRCHPRS